MKERIEKLRILWWMLTADLRMTFKTWHREVWERDLDNQYCCNGRECGCYGATVREMFGARRDA